MDNTPLKQKAIRKTYTFTQEDLDIIETTKDKLLNKRKVVTDSQVMRMGLHLLSSRSETELTKLAQEVPTLLKRSKSD